MSDLFYPQNMDKHNLRILYFIDCLRYQVIPGRHFAFIYASDRYLDGKFSEPRTHTKIPGKYFLHVRHCLWRYYLLDRMQHRKKELKLQKSFIGFLQKMLVMLDTALEQLVYTCFKADEEELKVDQSFPLFDLYLATEFVVGYHDPNSVDQWRQHPDNEMKDLECMDPFQFDWDLYDHALGDLLSGRAAQYDINNVNKDMLEQLVTAVGQWYNMPTRYLTKAQCKAKVLDANVWMINGSQAGLGTGMLKDHNAPIIKGYELEEEMSESEWNDDVAKDKAAQEATDST